MFKRIVFISLHLAAFSAFSQSREAPSIVPLTPNAASLGTFGEVSVGYHTGQPNISIPLYQIDYPTISVPIRLSYNYNGLKVEEYPSWVGMGWTLEATGVINRQVRSKPDEIGGGYNSRDLIGQKVKAYIDDSNAAGVYAGSPGFSTWINAVTNSEHKDFLDNVRLGLNDSEPDVFFFNLPGHSGKFFFDHTQCATTTKEAIIIPRQNLRIVGHFDYDIPHNGAVGLILDFEVTDEKGNTYKFDVMEESETQRLDADNGNSQEASTNTWYLSEISDPYGNTIDYTYEPRTIDMPATISESDILPLENNYGVRIYNTSSSTEQILTRISYRDGEIDFTEEATDRLDWNSTTWRQGTTSDQPKALAQIRIMEHSNVIKVFDFEYSYFGSNARLRLDRITESNGVATKNPYEFFYKDWYKFPKIGDVNDLYSQDLWGYFNGVSQTTLLRPFVGEFSNGTPFYRAGNPRVPDAAPSAAGILTKVTYPTGGFTSFDFEANDYYDDSPSDEDPCAGTFDEVLAVFSIVDKKNHPAGVDFDDQYDSLLITQTVCARVDTHVKQARDCGESTAYVTLIDGLGVYYIHEGIDINGQFYSTGLYSSYETFSLKPGNYELRAGTSIEGQCDPPDPGNPTEYLDKIARASIKLLLVEPVESGGGRNTIAGGVRVSKMTSCPGGPCSGCTNQYFLYTDINNPSRSSGILNNKPIYQYSQDFKIDGPTGPEDYTGIVRASQSNVPLITTNGSPVGYKYVTVLEDADGLKGKKIYHFTTSETNPDIGSLAYPFPPKVDYSWQRGLTIDEKTYRNKNGQLELIRTDVTINTPVLTLSNQPSMLGLKMGKRTDFIDFPQLTPLVEDFYFEPYSIQTGWEKALSQYSIQQEAGQEFTTSSSYQYSNPDHMQVTEKSSTGSDGITLISQYKYRDDINAANYTAAEYQGIIASPYKTEVIEEKNLRGGEVVSTRRNIYNGINRAEIQISYGASSLEKEIEFTSYDTYGNILGYRTHAGETRSYLYGYGHRYPVAEVINADPTDIFVESFEEDGVILLSPTTGNNFAKSGIKVHDGGSYTFPSSFQPLNASMMMSYWFWDGSEWNFSGEIPYSASITTSSLKLDEVRAFPEGSLMTTYTYEPGKGLISVTDQNNITAHYKYDDLGRLIEVRDDKGQVLKAVEYQYK